MRARRRRGWPRRRRLGRRAMHAVPLGRRGGLCPARGVILRGMQPAGRADRPMVKWTGGVMYPSRITRLPVAVLAVLAGAAVLASVLPAARCGAVWGRPRGTGRGLGDRPAAGAVGPPAAAVADDGRGIVDDRAGGGRQRYGACQPHLRLLEPVSGGAHQRQLPADGGLGRLPAAVHHPGRPDPLPGNGIGQLQPVQPIPPAARPEGLPAG
jgi:hypothetical protein